MKEIYTEKLLSNKLGAGQYNNDTKCEYDSPYHFINK